MAHKSKTQRAKATTAKANKKDRELRDEVAQESTETAEVVAEEPAKTGILSRMKKTDDQPKKVETAAKQKVDIKKTNAAPKKERFKFLKDVRAEMKRVTWPTRQDVIRWSGVVVGALLFFGIYVAILDNVIITPILIAVSGLGA